MIPKILIISHPKGQIVAKKSGKLYVWYAILKIEDNDIFVSNNLVYIENGESKRRAVDKIFQSSVDALAFVNATFSKFESFEPKILTFDQEYEKEFTTAKINEWFNS